MCTLMPLVIESTFICRHATLALEMYVVILEGLYQWCMYLNGLEWHLNGIDMGLDYSQNGLGSLLQVTTSKQ